MLKTYRCFPIQWIKVFCFGLCLTGMALLNGVPNGFAQQRRVSERKMEKAFPVKASIVIRGPADGSVYQAPIGDVPTDRPVDLELTIVNASDERFNFNDVQVSCTCVRVSIPRSVLEPGKEIVCNALIDTRSKQRTHQFRVPIKLWDSTLKTEEIIVVLTGYLNGYLGFIDPFTVAEVSRSKRLVEVAVPFTATAPIAGELVHVEQHPKVGEYRFEAVKGTKESWNLILLVRPEDVPPEGIATELTLDDFATGRQAQCKLMLGHDTAARLSPRTLRLTSTQDEDFVGRAILSIRRPESEDQDASLIASDQNDSAGEASGMPIVSATIAGKPVAVSTKKMNDEHFRLTVRVPEL